MSDFEFLSIDRSDLEFLAVELHFRGQRLCQVYREENEGARGAVVIRFLSDFYVGIDVQMEFEMDQFMVALRRALTILDSEPMAPSNEQV